MVKVELSPSPFEIQRRKALAELRSLGKDISDLTISSPTQGGISYDISAELLYLSENPGWQYNTPDAQGQIYAREAVAKYHNCNADDIWITAGSSESYLTLFKLLCEKGDYILTPSPGYPLLDALAGIADLHCHPYFLRESGDHWEIDFDSFYSAPANTKILLLIAPHNPTGHLPSRLEWQNILAFCEEHALALVIDEVFGSYRFVESFKPDCSANVPVFRLDGLSKSLGLAHIKVGWIRAAGTFRDFDALEYILDASLNCSYLSQALCARALPNAEVFQERLMQRLNANREIISDMVSVPAHGGWYQCLYFDGADDEELCLRLMREHGIITHPGFLFDLPDGYLVISLLQRENVMQKFADCKLI